MEHREKDPEEGWGEHTPLIMGTGLLLRRRSHCTEHVRVEGHDTLSECSFGGDPISSRSWKRPLLLTRTNDFVGSMKARLIGLFCSCHFSLRYLVFTSVK